MVRTRVGYTGGTKKNPAYHSLGDHTEALQIDFDPARISYRELLDIFWKSHDPMSTGWSRQYKAAIFVQNDEQKRLALESKEREAELRNQPIHTEVIPITEFYNAEDYHQKYRLQNEPDIMAEFSSMFLSVKDFINSTSAARVNGYLGGYGTPEALQQELKILGLSEQGMKRLIGIVSARRPAFRACHV